MSRFLSIKGPKGQAALEYLMVVGVAMILSAPFIVKTQSSIMELRSGSNMMEVHSTVNKMESSINTVNAAGNPAKRTFYVELPQTVQKGYLNNKSIVYSVSSSQSTTNISRIFKTNLTGSIPQSPGRHKISVTAKTDSVDIKVIS